LVPQKILFVGDVNLYLIFIIYNLESNRLFSLGKIYYAMHLTNFAIFLL